MSPSLDARDIQRLATQWQASRALLAAFELDLFSALGDGALTGAEVGARAGCDGRAADRLLRVMVTLGLVELEGGGSDRFRNTEAARTWLDRSSPRCLTGLMHTAYTYKNWASLDAAARKGTAVIDTDFDNDDRRAAFIEAMHRRAKDQAADLAARLDLSGVGRMLDVGGGSGAYSMAFCRARDGLTAVIVDRPEVIALTRGYVAREGLSERIGFRPGDYNETDFGSGYDLVWLSAIVHINSFEQNRALLVRAAAALNPGGRVAVSDFILDETRTEPAFGAIFALNMLVNTRCGDTYTESEVRGWMEAAGLSGVTRQTTGPAANPTTSLMIGCKS